MSIVSGFCKPPLGLHDKSSSQFVLCVCWDVLFWLQYMKKIWPHADVWLKGRSVSGLHMWLCILFFATTPECNKS